MNYTNQRNDDIKSIVRRAEGLAETGLLSVIYYFIWRIWYRLDFAPSYYGRGKYILIFIYLLMALLAFHLCEGYQFGHLKLFDVISSQFISICMLNFMAYLQICLIANRMAIVYPMLFLTVIDFGVAIGCCWCFTALYHSRYVPHNMILIYGNDNAIDLKFKMDLREDKYTITEIMRYDVGHEEIVKRIGMHDSVILNDVPAVIRNDILKYCYHNEIRTYVVPKITDIIIKGAPNISLFDTPLILVKGRGLSAEQRVIKRAMDIILSLLALIPASIITVVVWVAIKMDDGGSIFYTQERYTKGGEKFKMYKFRSMRVHSEDDETFDAAVEDDPRITKVGKVIRRIRVDEVPQILNVLKGDLSIVGPRAENERSIEAGLTSIKEYSDRFKVKAGITGYAQVYGKYNTSAYDKLRMDLMYIENYSLLLDFKLLLMTIRTLFHSDSTEGFDKAEELKEKRQKVIAGSKQMEEKE
ncbi:MAG: exopolysaccharide biosynthesis polyprenyl glycosylphosphotransferase [Butyrivibrio sp.]|nr:exopolysaccharide biosynthesis polyprenyl glycosylphosphotransferase [Butyrivibrio sp.]